MRRARRLVQTDANDAPRCPRFSRERAPAPQIQQKPAQSSNDTLAHAIAATTRASIVEGDSLPTLPPPRLDHRHRKEPDRRPVEQGRRLVLQEDDPPQKRREPERRERVRLVLAHDDGVRDW